ncbi:TnpV protein [Listeria booriae]|uniref:TnpV protein n=2 Tax=Listeria booriae TaxID=1552123 RepID=A0A7X0XQB6_9LIST|nr:TnpV protein [Listeria booriae]MBC2002628.1 TnpV protein [Listeria booriae]MBC2327222.1 TnpV protein [Listeria booriae]
METKMLGKYGRMRRTYLQEHKPMQFQTMVIENTLESHLQEVDQVANQRLDFLMDQLLEKQQPPSRESDQMEWVKHMNTLKAQAEEVIKTELIYN